MSLSAFVRGMSPGHPGVGRVPIMEPVGATRSMPTPSKRPAPVVEVAVEEITPWRVILFNDDVHSFDEVIGQLVKALRCSASHATALAREAHETGRAVVFEGEMEECLRIDGVLKEIELITEIQG